MTFQKPFAVSAVAAACQRTDNKAPSNTAPSGVYIDALVRPTFYLCLAAVGKLSPKDRRPRPLLAFFDAQNPPGESVAFTPPGRMFYAAILLWMAAFMVPFRVANSH